MIPSIRQSLLSLSLLPVLAACASTGTQYASLKVAPDPDLPPITSTTLDAWEVERKTVQAQFEDLMYGTWPEGLSVTLGETRIVDENYLDGRGRLEETPILLGDPDVEDGQRVFLLVVAYPKNVDGPMPVVIGQTFSDNCQVFQSRDLTASRPGACDQIDFRGFGGWAIKTILGRYIAKAPMEDYFDRGIAYANFYASSIVPDSARGGTFVMDKIRQNNAGITASSALTYWGYGWSAAIDFFEQDARIDQDRIGIIGHSRHGKSALLASVYEPRIDLVISHQSGFGGSASNRSRAGERIDRVAKSYPHWFTPAFQPYAADPETLPFDQHHLIALAAPTPLLIGNGRRDVWSDPNSSYEAAYLADPIWELQGSEGLQQDGLKDYNPSADLSFGMTGGSHGITPEDVKMFFRFIDAHFGTHP